jgi:sigma-B regulation protein RsbU (phosphoserine phosphatase)
MGTPTLCYSDADGLHSVDLDRDSTSIGRSPSQDIVLSDRYVSRHHAVIVREGDIYTVVDQNSTHGTFLNATRVERAILNSGDILQMGSLKSLQLRFHLKQENQTTGGLPQSPVNHLLSSLSELRLPASELRPPAREMEKLNWLLRAARQLNKGRAIEDILSAFLHLTLQLTGLERSRSLRRDRRNHRQSSGAKSGSGRLHIAKD